MPKPKSIKCTMDPLYFCANTIITCIDILLIYRKDKRDNSDNFNIIEENECLLIEIIGEESFGRRYLQQLHQLQREMWTGSIDLFRISKEGEKNIY